MKRTIVFVALLSVSLLPPIFAEEQPKAPKTSADQKVTLLTAERDYLLALQQAQQAEQAVQQALQNFQAKETEVLKQIGADPEKWDFNVNTMQFVAKTKAEPKPAEKPVANETK